MIFIKETYFMFNLNLIYFRFYNLNNGLVKIRMANAEMNYSFEYLGNESPLVRTPLTDKCFLTLTQVCRTFYVNANN